MQKKILITGASGFLGSNFCTLEKDHFTLCGTVHSRSINLAGVQLIQTDLTDYRAMKELLSGYKPGSVIHTAALANPNRCQENPGLSKRLNITVPVNLAGLCYERNIPFLFTSTDMVFDGSTPPYRETDPTTPINRYGEHKALAEEKIMELSPDAVICRMAWMYGEHPFEPGRCLSRVAADMKAGNELRFFTDEIRSSLGVFSAVKGLAAMLKTKGGLYHLGGPESLSRYRFGEILGRYIGLEEPLLIPITRGDLKMAAPRPQDLSLCTDKAVSLGFRPLYIEDELEKIIPELKSAKVE